jgi:sarcosine oxidase
MRIGVVGAGVVGLAITHELACGGHEVRCFEAEVPMGARSVGETRIFRLAHATPALVEWGSRARRGWQAWSDAAGVPLVGSEGTVASGNIGDLAAALTAAGAPHRVTDEAPPSLPATDPVGPFLVDPAGGVIQAAATGRFLSGSIGEQVTRAAVTQIELRGPGTVIVTADESWGCDSVVIAAGAATPLLAAQVDIHVPDELVHHARFTFSLLDPRSTPPCWMDRGETWRPGFTTYAHCAGPGRWAVGGHLPLAQTHWGLDREDVIEISRNIVSAYVADYVTGAAPEVVETLYCNFTAGLDDGVSVARAGPVLAIWGDNLFKLAPRLGEVLARAAVDVSVPSELDDIRHPV